MAPILRGRRWHNDRPPRRRGPLSPEAPAMLRWFESRLDPFPPDPPAQPPASLYAFCRHYTRGAERSEEHTSELQSLMRISYAVFCLKKKNNKQARLKQTKL